MLRSLLEQHEATHSTYRIAEIWAWEAVNHGDSYLVNEKNLGGICKSQRVSMLCADSRQTTGRITVET